MPPWLDPRNAAGSLSLSLQVAGASAALPVLIALVIAFAAQAESVLAKACASGGPWIPAQLVAFTWLYAPHPEPNGTWHWLRREIDPDADVQHVRAGIIVGVGVLIAMAAAIDARIGRRAVRTPHAIAAVIAWLAGGFELAVLAETAIYLAERTAYLREESVLVDLTLPIVISLVFFAGATWLTVLSTHPRSAAG